MSHQDHAHPAATAHAHPPYLKVFALLVALTVVEVVVPFVLTGSRGIAATLLIVISVVKILFIARYFMHLKFDAKILGLVACAPLVCASILSFVLLWDH
ncbi:MAG: hypothetical protein EXS14_09215 [Planctomycetes bacterium]|nr:hypothetical protein [Planctomycetota bacterium]